MTRDLSDTLTVLPPPKRLNMRGRLACSLSCHDGRAILRLSREAVRHLGAPGQVRFLASKNLLAVVATDASDRYARRVRHDNDLNLTDQIEALCLRDGDAFTIELTPRDEMLVGDLPTPVFVRRSQRERRTA